MSAKFLATSIIGSFKSSERSKASSGDCGNRTEQVEQLEEDGDDVGVLKEEQRVEDAVARVRSASLAWYRVAVRSAQRGSEVIAYGIVHKHEAF